MHHFELNDQLLEKKKLILYARSRKKKTIKPILKKKDILKYRNFNFEFDHSVASNNSLLLFSG